LLNPASDLTVLRALLEERLGEGLSVTGTGEMRAAEPECISLLGGATITQMMANALRIKIRAYVGRVACPCAFFIVAP
jgi:hypothetical protein